MVEVFVECVWYVVFDDFVVDFLFGIDIGLDVFGGDVFDLVIVSFVECGVWNDWCEINVIFKIIMCYLVLVGFCWIGLFGFVV